jgi:hypothetical protein
MIGEIERFDELWNFGDVFLEFFEGIDFSSTGGKLDVPRKLGVFRFRKISFVRSSPTLFSRYNRFTD